MRKVIKSGQDVAMKTDVPCHCGSQVDFENCCYRLLVGKSKAESPESLMRSRYTAYKLGGYGKYLYQTWTTQGRSCLTPTELDRKDRVWLALNVISAQHNELQGIVKFVASFQGINNQVQEHKETSLFLFEKGDWKYDRALILQ